MVKVRGEYHGLFACLSSKADSEILEFRVTKENPRLFRRRYKVFTHLLCIYWIFFDFLGGAD